jgi:hypothetical protein
MVEQEWQTYHGTMENTNTQCDSGAKEEWQTYHGTMVMFPQNIVRARKSFNRVLYARW